MNPTILDVDTGIDDALAIAYAVRSPALEVLGITTCFGNVSAEEASCNTLTVLDYLESDIPVYQGAGEPLFRKYLGEKAVAIHGEDGLGNRADRILKRGIEKQHAVDFMIEQIKRRPGEVTLVCVGTMTNLALALMKAPEIAGLMKRAVIMGGAVTVPGNVTPWAEANIHNDPEAAEWLFRSSAPVTMVGLDVTMQTLLPEEELDRWRRKNTPLASFMADISEFYIQCYKRNYPGIRGCGLHDPLAVGAVIDPTFVTTVPMHVQVDLEGSLSLARTIGDRREQPDRRPNADVCLTVDADRFLAHFLENTV
ncbi:nucleoside hydrolase [Cohnella caldifontis]|uniref:nucleoside hydrolase n=1 Tax=Cohnella caldifontis TaxID=3027471 RepID=UPI0023EC53CA|nr:nucleoside hydrolase [Cohnella sp. YIM B05605]